MTKISFQTIYTVLLLALGLYFAWLFIPRSCDSKPSKLEVKSDQSLNLSAIQKRITDSIKLVSDKEIKALYQKDSISKVQIKSLSGERNRLLAIVRGFTNVRIDTVNNTVNDIPIAVYEAEMNANAICDTLLNFKDVQISIRDSVIFLRELELKSCENMNQANEQALKDIIPLVGELKTKLKKAQNTNKKLTVALIIDTALHFFH